MNFVLGHFSVKQPSLSLTNGYACSLPSPSKKTTSQQKFPSQASGLTSAVKNNADYIPNLTPLFNKLQDKIENTVVKNKFKPVTQITLDSFSKPTDQQTNVHVYVCFI
jgi:hypothetical protein